MSRIIVSADCREHEVISYLVHDGEVCAIVLDRELKQLACRALRTLRFEREEFVLDDGHIQIVIPESQMLEVKSVETSLGAKTKPNEGGF